MVSAKCDSAATASAVTIALKEISMHAAAMNPSFLDESQIDESVIEKEKEIARAQLIKEGKPEAILEKILPGKIKRFLQDNTLVAQKFVMNDRSSRRRFRSRSSCTDGIISYITSELHKRVISLPSL